MRDGYSFLDTDYNNALKTGRGTGVFGSPKNQQERDGIKAHKADQVAAEEANADSGRTSSGSGHTGDDVRPLAKVAVVAALIALPLIAIKVSLGVHEQKLQAQAHPVHDQMTNLTPQNPAAAKSIKHAGKSTTETKKATAPKKIVSVQPSGPILTQAYEYKNGFGTCNLPQGTHIQIDNKTDRGVTYVTIPKADALCPKGVLTPYNSVDVPSDIIGTAAKKAETKSAPKAPDDKTSYVTPARNDYYGRVAMRMNGVATSAPKAG